MSSTSAHVAFICVCVCVCVVFRGVEGGQHDAVSPFAPLYAWIPLNSGATAWSQCRPYPCPGRPFACQTVSALSAFIEFHYSFMSVRRERAVRNVIIKGRLHARTPLPLSPLPLGLFAQYLPPGQNNEKTSGKRTEDDDATMSETDVVVINGKLF